MAVSRIDLVPASRLLHDVRAAGVGWRLLGANNRELGRSVRVHAPLCLAPTMQANFSLER